MRLDDVPREVMAAVALAALLCLLVVYARGALARRRRRRRFERASEGEREAAVLLARSGYEIEAVQATTTYDVEVDGAPVAVVVRADYVVVRGGRRFVAEVKTGRVAPRIDSSATRRQLLEYQHAFGVAGVLLVDADDETVRLVSFLVLAAR